MPGLNLSKAVGFLPTILLKTCKHLSSRLQMFKIAFLKTQAFSDSNTGVFR